MIFVTLGTQSFPFNRLLRALDDIPEDLVVQGGAAPGFRPARAAWFDYLELPELVQHVRAARVIVSHAGVGSVITVVSQGKRPVVVPRLPRYGEAVDDHQVPFARRAAEAGLVTLVEDPTTLPGVLASTPPPPATIHDNGAIVAELRAYLRDLVGYSR